MNKKFGFTLAEVLITLAIIGVVAALILPTLLSNYQKKEWTTKLIKTHAEIQQAINLLMAQNNTSSLSETNAWASMKVEKCDYSNLQTSDCEGLRNAILNIFEGSSFVNINELNYNTPCSYLRGDEVACPSGYGILLRNGALLNNLTFYKTPRISDYDVKSMNGNMTNRVIWLGIDVNAGKGPNTTGRDGFGFIVDDKGIVYAQGSREVGISYHGSKNAVWSNDSYNNRLASCQTYNYSAGNGCAARILETGKMDY